MCKDGIELQTTDLYGKICFEDAVDQDRNEIALEDAGPDCSGCSRRVATRINISKFEQERSNFNVCYVIRKMLETLC